MNGKTEPLYGKRLIYELICFVFARKQKHVWILMLKIFTFLVDDTKIRNTGMLVRSPHNSIRPHRSHFP